MRARSADSPAHLSRRHFLRGVGACVALPFLSSLRPNTLLAGGITRDQLATTATGAPLRSLFIFFPNGAIPATWWPTHTGADFPLSRTLQPLQRHTSLVQVLGGIDQRTAEPGPDGAGDHARGNGTFLTGVRLLKSATHVRAGISIDQKLARHVGHLTRFPSLELTCDAGRHAGACDSGYACAYQYNLSWTSPSTPRTPEANPRLVFERLFGSGPPGQRWRNLQQRREQERSVLDLVMEDAHAMQRRLNADDRRKLDQYLTDVREIEGRIQQAERFGKVKDPAIATPAGIPAQYADHVRLMYDMLVLAFQTDSTRVATLLLAHDGNNRSFENIGISEGHHDLTHHMGRKEWIAKVSDIDRWYVQQLAHFFDRLQGIKDADGHSILYNSMIVYGSGNADANRHTHRNLPVLLAGAGGGTLQTGRYVQHGGRPMTNLYLSMAHRMGVNDVKRFGDSTGVLTGI